MASSTTLILPTGRIVNGDVYKKQTESDGSPLKFKDGPKIGQERNQWFFGVTIPKAGEQHWSQTSWGRQIWAVGVAFKPNAANMKDFAWKISDGDDPSLHIDDDGNPRERKHLRGCWYVRLSSGYAPGVATLVGRQNPEYDLTPGLVYPGCHVQVQITCDPNNSQKTPGVYLNHKVVCLIREDERIESFVQQDVTKIGFGASMPAGASVAPPGVTALPLPAAAVAPLPLPAAAPLPVPAAAPLPVPAAAVAPLPVPAAAAPLPVPNPAFLQVPAVPTLTAKAPPGATYQQFRDAGWTDDQMRQQGYLA